MNSTLLSFIEKNIKSNKLYFYRRDKYRTWRWSFNEIYQQSKRFARLLHDLDINKGDKVMLKSENRPEWVIVYTGTLLRGGSYCASGFKNRT